MKNLFMVVAVICAGAFAAVGTAVAGAPIPGTVACNSEFEMCVNGFLWEVSYKCEGGWADDSTNVNITGKKAELRADGSGNSDCDVDINLESDDRISKYEAKCEDDNGDKVELEIKATFDDDCST